jgi:uncharacterized protein YjbI with pentapeptide repeats
MTQIMNGNRVVLHEAPGSIRDVAEDATRKGISLCGAKLAHANLASAELPGLDLTNADLWDTFLWHANLRGAKLAYANLAHANLLGMDLMNADLREADLEGVDLEGVDLRGANLSGTQFRGTALRGANLSGVQLRGANLCHIRADFFAILNTATAEIPFFREALLAGRINGITYEGDCACLVGTLAKARSWFAAIFKPWPKRKRQIISQSEL